MSTMKIVGIWLILSVLSAAAHAGTKHYYYTDAQGTVLAKTDAQGNILATHDYKPYGAQVLGTPPSGPTGYTGHVNDPDTGLVYMQARYYDPDLGRFLSVDPVGPTPNKVFGFNRYNYVNNNPVINVDPDGRYKCETGDKAFCQRIRDYISKLKESRDALRSSPDTRRELRLVQKVLTEIGEEGKAGPNYIQGEIPGRPSAHTNQNGTTTVDVKKLDAQDAKANQLGAQALAHEARHDIDIRDSGIKTTESAVRETERNAYDASKAVDRGFGLKWTNQEYNDAVDASVQSWLDKD